MSRPEPQSNASVAARWATRVTSIGLEFALPALLGGYLDRIWRTGRVLTVAGALLGFIAGMVHVLAIAREAAGEIPAGRRRGTAAPPADPLGETNESGRADHG